MTVPWGAQPQPTARRSQAFALEVLCSKLGQPRVQPFGQAVFGRAMQIAASRRRLTTGTGSCWNFRYGLYCRLLSFVFPKVSIANGAT